MSEIPFEDEDQLQRALQHQPDLIPGDQVEPDDPRRWLLIDREAGIPVSASSVGRSPKLVMSWRSTRRTRDRPPIQRLPVMRSTIPATHTKPRLC